MENVIRITEMNKNRKAALYNIIAKRYGMESNIFEYGHSRGIGLEDLENELEANDEAVDESKPYADPEETTEVGVDTGDDGLGEDMGEDPTMMDQPQYSEEEERLMGPEDEYSEMDKDGQMGDYTTDVEPAEWEETDYDSLRSDADCINMTKVIGQYVNNYALQLEEFVKRNRDMIDYSGDLKQIPWFNTFVNPAMELIKKVFMDDPIVKHLENLIETMSNKRNMLSITGKQDSPFLYEGMQIVLIDTIRNVLACIPYSVKNNQNLSEVIESMKLNVIKCLVQMVADLVEVSPMFGTKIYYVEPIVSEITGKSEEIANTPYSNLEVMQRGQESAFSYMRLANESIMNLVEIKNNKALVEYSALSKMMVVITGLTKDVNLMESADKVLRTVLNLTTTDNENLIPMIDEALETLRNEVFVPEIKAMADLTAKESEQLTEEPETNVEISSGADDIAGTSETKIEEELDDESEEVTDFDQDI